MDTLKTALRTIAQWVMLLMIGFVGWVEAGSVDLYQQALVAEKNAGDLQTALGLYEQILETVTGEDAWMVDQVRGRVVVLRERLGLPKRVEGPSVTSSFQQVFMRDQTRLRSAPYVSEIDRHVLDWKAQLGVDRFVGEPEALLEHSWIEVQFHKMRKALGVQSFSEKLAMVADQRRQLRPMGLVTLFQAGLHAEKGVGDFNTAVIYYRRALEIASPDVYKVLIERRLAFCQQQVQP